MSDEFDAWDDSDDHPYSEENPEEESFLWEESDIDEPKERINDDSKNGEDHGWSSDDSLQREAEDLQRRAEGIERSKPAHQVSFGTKWCPTRHGCQGTTDCDYCLASSK